MFQGVLCLNIINNLKGLHTNAGSWDSYPTFSLFPESTTINQISTQVAVIPAASAKLDPVSISFSIRFNPLAISIFPLIKSIINV